MLSLFFLFMLLIILYIHNIVYYVYTTRYFYLVLHCIVVNRIKVSVCTVPTIVLPTHHTVLPQQEPSLDIGPTAATMTAAL